MNKIFILLNICLLIKYIHSQDYQNSLISCDDSYNTCSLNCIMPKYREGETLAWPYNTPMTITQMKNCISLCSSKKNSCTDSELITSTNTCTESCANELDEGMLSCLQEKSTTSKSSYNQNQDLCMNLASAKYDVCSEECVGTDRFYGWSPEAEENLSGINDKYSYGTSERLRVFQELAAKHSNLRN